MNYTIKLFKKYINIGINTTTIVENSLGEIDGNGIQASIGSPQGIYFDSSSKNLLVVDQGFNSIRKMNQSGLFFAN